MPPDNSQPQDHPNEPLLEAQLLQSQQIGEETNGLLEAIVQQGEKNNPEPLLEAQITQAKQNTDRIVEALAPTSEATSKMASFLAEMKGEKGDQGERGAQGDQGESVLGEKGDQGIRGTDGEDGKDGRDGQDGEDGKDGRDGQDGKDSVAPGPKGLQGEPGRDGKDGKPDNDTPEKLKSLKKQIDNLAKVPFQGSMQTYRVDNVLIANGQVLNIKTGPGITLVPVQTKDGIDLTISALGGGSTSVTIPVGSVNGSNVTFTVSATPLWITNDGIVYYNGAGYSIAGLTVTMEVPPSSYIRAII